MDEDGDVPALLVKGAVPSARVVGVGESDIRTKEECTRREGG